MLSKSGKVFVLFVVPRCDYLIFHYFVCYILADINEKVITLNEKYILQSFVLDDMTLEM